MTFVPTVMKIFLFMICFFVLSINWSAFFVWFACRIFLLLATFGSFSVAADEAWNGLPSSVVLAPLFEIFWQCFKTYLFSHSFMSFLLNKDEQESVSLCWSYTLLCSGWFFAIRYNHIVCNWLLHFSFFLFFFFFSFSIFGYFIIDYL